MGVILKSSLLILLSIFLSSELLAQRVDLGSGRARKNSNYHKEADSGLGLRTIRRAGVSLVAAGELGLGGGKIELNLTPQWSFSAGVGGSSDFSAFSFQVTRYLSGTNFLPYTGVGIARWYGNNDGPIGNTTPSILSDTLMSSGDKASGKIRELLITPKLGLQYLAPNGEYAGYGFFAEVVLFVDIQDLVMAPTGALGVSYYF